MTSACVNPKFSLLYIRGVDEKYVARLITLKRGCNSRSRNTNENIHDAVMGVFILYSGNCRRLSKRECLHVLKAAGFGGGMSHAKHVRMTGEKNSRPRNASKDSHGIPWGFLFAFVWSGNCRVFLNVNVFTFKKLRFRRSAKPWAKRACVARVRKIPAPAMFLIIYTKKPLYIKWFFSLPRAKIFYSRIEEIIWFSWVVDSSWYVYYI